MAYYSSGTIYHVNDVLTLGSQSILDLEALETGGYAVLYGDEDDVFAATYNNNGTERADKFMVVDGAAEETIDGKITKLVNGSSGADDFNLSYSTYVPTSSNLPLEVYQEQWTDDGQVVSGSSSLVSGAADQHQHTLLTTHTNDGGHAVLWSKNYESLQGRIYDSSGNPLSGSFELVADPAPLATGNTQSIRAFGLDTLADGDLIISAKTYDPGADEYATSIYRHDGASTNPATKVATISDAIPYSEVAGLADGGMWSLMTRRARRSIGKSNFNVLTRTINL